MLMASHAHNKGVTGGKLLQNRVSISDLRHYPVDRVNWVMAQIYPMKFVTGIIRAATALSHKIPGKPIISALAGAHPIAKSQIVFTDSSERIRGAAPVDHKLRRIS
jgi:hypothetical protein